MGDIYSFLEEFVAITEWFVSVIIPTSLFIGALKYSAERLNDWKIRLLHNSLLILLVALITIKILVLGNGPHIHSSEGEFNFGFRYALVAFMGLFLQFMVDHVAVRLANFENSS